MPKSIRKILIANRGEIAVRVMRTCREMGIATVAVFSEADRDAVFVRMADEAYCIGTAPSADSYLCIDKIIAVAKKAKADAIHPGYGFLSEKSAFSAECAKAKIVFLGPTPSAIEAMGDKVTAREHAKKAKVPMVPGTLEPVDDIVSIKKLAKEFGYPVLLKAAAGGGGKGMRVVRSEAEIMSAFEQARGEAEKSFGDGRLYLEKYVVNPRHVEIQIARDTHGKGYFLLERECSMQRRHQKVIEEAPCFYLKESARKKMAECALKLADKIDYHGVGTVEFLVDQKQNFYFLEMNTRLQVEHCVTEMITGLDLVRLQIQIGQGEKLTLKQKNIVANGHAIECRIYAEDPKQNFMPSPGKIQFLNVPEGNGVRHDSGVTAGSTISIYYDPMIAKLIVHASTRENARLKMLAALREYQVGGVINNIEFLNTLLCCREFIEGAMHTQFIDKNPKLTELQVEVSDDAFEAALAVAVYKSLHGRKDSDSQGHADVVSNWWRTGMEESLR